jgi:hypothetical protein
VKHIDSRDAAVAGLVLTDVGRLLDEGKSKQDIYDEMATLYPDWVSHQSWLKFNYPPLQSTQR